MFKTTSIKGTIAMRIINMLGSVAFVFYGLLIKATATAITNFILFFLNLSYIIIEIKSHNKNINTSKAE